MQDGKGQNTPMYRNSNWYESGDLMNVPYREAIGCLMYFATGTRPNCLICLNMG